MTGTPESRRLIHANDVPSSMRMRRGWHPAHQTNHKQVGAMGRDESMRLWGLVCLLPLAVGCSPSKPPVWSPAAVPGEPPATAKARLEGEAIVVAHIEHPVNSGPLGHVPQPYTTLSFSDEYVAFRHYKSGREPTALIVCGHVNGTPFIVSLETMFSAEPAFDTAPNATDFISSTEANCNHARAVATRPGYRPPLF